MKKINKFLIFFSIFLLLMMPVVSLAQDTPLVRCGTSTNPAPCGFADLINLVNTVIHFILFDMVIPIAAIMFLYAGFELVTSGGSTEKRGIAKKVFTNAVIGLVIAIACWLIVATILSILGYDGAWIGLKL